jgi:hypothetical protein
MPSIDTDEHPDPVRLCEGELYRDGDGHEVWRIKEIGTGRVLREGIASDSEYKWLLETFNHGEEYAAEQDGCAFCTPADAGELREELAEIYTRDFLMPSMCDRACRVISKLVRATGLSEEEIIATAKDDAECLLAMSELVA